MPTEPVDDFSAITHCASHFDPVAQSQQGTNALTHEVLVVGNHYPDFYGLGAVHRITDSAGNTTLSTKAPLCVLHSSLPDKARTRSSMPFSPLPGITSPLSFPSSRTSRVSPASVR